MYTHCSFTVRLSLSAFGILLQVRVSPGGMKRTSELQDAKTTYYRTPPLPWAAVLQERGKIMHLKSPLPHPKISLLSIRCIVR